MFSLDTNVLVYAANEDCAEHHAAKKLVDMALADPDRWLLAEQVLFEFYKALRNPKVLTHPLGAVDAFERLRFLRDEAGFAFCCYELRHWNAVATRLAAPDFPYQRTHDALLGATLVQNGVTTFYTRNRKHFLEAGFEKVVDPIGEERGGD